MSGAGRRANNTDTAPSRTGRNRWVSAFEEVLRDIVVVSPKADPLLDEEVPSPDPALINVTSVDLDILNNTKEHRTDEFEITDRLDGDQRELLVIRRGQTFNLSIEFDRDYDKENDDLRLVFQFGKNPDPTKGTHAEFVLSERDDWESWGAYIKSKGSKSISLVLMTPPTCPVGKWRMNIDVIKRDDNGTSDFRYAHQDPIYILFNPWCKKDQVYFHEKGEKLLDEYILKETGKLYCGSENWIGDHPWDYGQFTGNVLDCILLLLDESSLKDHARGDPVLVSRKLSALINSMDGSGVLTGNWSGNYTGGTSPLEWTGSADILEKYYKTKSAVCYGQCWVFSGVLTTACRAVGIPARSVTNFSSAHDTDGSITIDTVKDHTGKEMDNSDSVWNFHVWNDVWMARPDLPGGYGGWQAIDATPQETSDGIFRMGPMSLAAIKRGEVTLPYDGPFVFAEVNADSVEWVMTKEKEMVVTSVDKNRVGKSMSTKKPLKRYREDVTDQYKYPEGSDEERAAVRRANMASAVSYTPYKAPVAEDVTFELTSLKDTPIGKTIEVTMTITNTSAENRTLNGTVLLSSMYYTGVVHKQIEKLKIKDLTLKSNEVKVETIKVTSYAYLDKLMDHCICRISSLCFVKETKQISSEMKELRLGKPELNVKAPEKGVVGEKFEVEVSFDNPLHVTMTKCELRVEGSHLQRPIIYKQDDVAANTTFTGKFEMTPSKAGEREMIIYFNCSQIHAITGSHAIKVAKKEQ